VSIQGEILVFIIFDLLLQFAEDGGKLMIKNGWFEQPPTASDRDSLVKKKGDA
jgi:hypothetical protein